MPNESESILISSILRPGTPRNGASERSDREKEKGGGRDLSGKELVLTQTRLQKLNESEFKSINIEPEDDSKAGFSEKEKKHILEYIRSETVVPLSGKLWETEKGIPMEFSLNYLVNIEGALFEVSISSFDPNILDKLYTEKSSPAKSSPTHS